jgi:(1->4)-alpha-D-glucan 1-alpha-D-glucosylmutase
LQDRVYLERVESFLSGIDQLDQLCRYLSLREENSTPSSVMARPMFVVVEKILSGSETLQSWPVEGTTGYDFLNDVSRLFVNPRNAPIMRRIYRSFTGLTDPYADVVYDCKKLITWTGLASELNVLAHALNRISESDRRTRDFTLDSLREALREVATCFPVYRTYVGPTGATESDKQVIDLAILRARQRNPAMEASVFDFVRDCLAPNPNNTTAENFQKQLQFALKFQQYTGPLQAKGVEDTSFYRYNVLVSLNEVGGDPQRFGGTINQFHQANQLRQKTCPHALLATATHDTKRGEDARTRIHVLSEIPRTWYKRVNRWVEMNKDCRTIVDGNPAPDRNDEYLFYQTLVGCWPAKSEDNASPSELVTRLRNYMLKAIKEAKVHTSWITPNDAYEHTVPSAVSTIPAQDCPRWHDQLTRTSGLEDDIARFARLLSGHGTLGLEPGRSRQSAACGI